MNNSHFIKATSQKYQLGNLKKWSKIPEGLVNTKFLLQTNKGKFVVRISSKTKKQLEFEVSLYNHIKSLTVPQLALCSNKKYISIYKDKPFIVYKYIPGHTPKRITHSLVKQVGQFQARFHNLGKSFHHKISREPYTYDFPKKKVQSFHYQIARKIPKEFKASYNVVKKTLLSIRLPNRLPCGPIHLDIKPENVLVRDGKLVGILDFDNGYIGPYLVDLSKTIMWFCIKSGKLDNKKLESFLNAYQQIRPLTKIENGLLDHAILHAVASHIFIDYYRYQKGITPLAYLRMLHQEFYPILEKHENNHKK